LTTEHSVEQLIPLRLEYILLLLYVHQNSMARSDIHDV